MENLGKILVLVGVCVPILFGRVEAQDATNRQGRDGTAVFVKFGAFRITNTIIELRCEVINCTGGDIWVCDDPHSIAANETNAAVFVDKDDRTLVVAKRIGLSCWEQVWANVRATYSRLRAGENRSVVLSVQFPIILHADYAQGFFRVFDEGVDHLTRATFEIGYFTDRDLASLRPGLHPSQTIDPDEPGDRIVIYDSTQGQLCRGERAARMTVDGLCIPYKEWFRGGVAHEDRPLQLGVQDAFNSFGLGLEEYRYAQRLMAIDEGLLTGKARQIADALAQVARGELGSERLTQSLDTILDESNRNRLLQELESEQGRVDQQRQTQIRELVAEAKRLDNRLDGRKALGLLRQALRIKGSHVEVLDLMQKISSYYRGEVITNSVGMELTWIPAGEFLMGSDQVIYLAPRHKVRISRGFWIGVREATQAQYAAIMGENPSRSQEDDLPVTSVTWDEAVDFCRQLSRQEGKTYRLPTDAEWEYVCRMGAGQDGRSSDTPTASADSGDAFHVVNMDNGIAEWCQDWFGGATGPELDPQGPSEPEGGRLRVIRSMRRSGSSTSGKPSCFARGRIEPEMAEAFISFRVVLEDD